MKTSLFTKTSSLSRDALHGGSEAKVLRSWRWSLATALAGALALVGCGDSSESPEGGGGAGTGGDVTDGGGAEGGGDHGGGTVEGAPPRCADLGGDASFLGVDRAEFDGSATVQGCEGGYDEEAGTLDVTFSGSIVVGFEEGGLTIDGVACTTSTGSKLVLAEDTAIHLVGGASDDAVLFDLATGSPAALALTESAGLSVDLGGGKNRVLLAGSEGNDAILAAEASDAAVFDFDGDGDAEASVVGATTMVISLGPGDDLYDGAPEGMTPVATNTTICAGAGDDDIRGGSGLDVYEGEAGDDIMRAGADVDASDLFDGGDGVDKVSYAARTKAVTITLDDSQDDGATGEKDNVLMTNEIIEGGAGDDLLRGTDRPDVILGGPGNDTIEGGPGDDELDGGAGDDVFLGSQEIDGADIVNGGPGMDSISYADRGQGISVTLCTWSGNEGCDATAGCTCAADDGEPGEADNLTNVEGVEGTPFADQMTGSEASDTLEGGAGDDVLIGNAGDDSMFGDEGSDQLDGGEGDDYLDGGDGMDSFAGGGGQGDICVIGPSETAPTCELF